MKANIISKSTLEVHQFAMQTHAGSTSMNTTGLTIQYSSSELKFNSQSIQKYICVSMGIGGNGRDVIGLAASMSGKGSALATVSRRYDG